MVGASLIAEERVGPQQSLMIVVQSSIQVLTLAINVSAVGSGVSARKILLDSRSTRQKTDVSCNLPPLHLCLPKQLSSYFHNLSRPPNQPIQLLFGRAGNKVQHRLAAELRPISDNMAGSDMGKGHRKAPYCERERGE